MKYRHAHHAGNFADAMKHIVLIAVIDALQRKPSPFVYLETHAGRGLYPLPANGAQRNDEFARGAGCLLESAQTPASLQHYADLVRRLGGARHPADSIRQYPGSPLIAMALLRPIDRAVFCELAPREAEALHSHLRHYCNATVVPGDGYDAIRAQLPPRERRGLCLIDPPYELGGEQERAVESLRDSVERFPTGVYALWYPIKRRADVQRFHTLLAASAMRRILCAELCLYPDDSRVSLNGSGMIIVNPPWQLDRQLQAALAALRTQLGGISGTSARTWWLVPE